jgi:hypothetical protein
MKRTELDVAGLEALDAETQRAVNGGSDGSEKSGSSVSWDPLIWSHAPQHWVGPLHGPYPQPTVPRQGAY